MQNTKKEEIHALWDDLCDIGPQEIDAALNLCMKRLCGMVGAQNAFWVGVVRVSHESPDLMLGWRIRGIQFMDQDYLDVTYTKEEGKSTIILDPGLTNQALSATMGRFRSYRLNAGTLVDLESFRETAHYDYYYVQQGINDRMWVGFPISADSESFFCFDRFGKHGEFDDDDLALVTYALRGIKWFHRQLLLSHGVGICLEPLTEAERRVKKHLLSGASEKEIALQLNLTPGTVHQYATRIYRKFGVQGRAGFMSLWLPGG